MSGEAFATAASATLELAVEGIEVDLHDLESPRRQRVDAIALGTPAISRPAPGRSRRSVPEDLEKEVQSATLKSVRCTATASRVPSSRFDSPMFALLWWRECSAGARVGFSRRLQSAVAIAWTAPARPFGRR
jgi:hypothetical protein